MNRKKIYLLIAIFVVVTICLGGTFAWWTWETAEEQRTEVVFTIEEDFSCAADGGGNITSDDVVLAPASCTNGNLAIKREIKVMPTIDKNNMNVLMNLWLDINELGIGLSDSENFRYALTTNSNSCTSGVVSEGNFYNKSVGDTITILQKEYSSTVAETYYLYIWLDAEETSLSTANQPFDLEINGVCNNVFVNFDANGGTFESISYNSSGNYVYNVAKDGIYRLETWGAQGGNANNLTGGYGGYSTGSISSLVGEKMYVYVGGKGTNGSATENYTASGGYNGGGNGYVGTAAYYVSGGGGASHISVTDGLLSNISSNTDDILIVAGGGAGAAYNKDTYKTFTIGHGGGFEGVQSSGTSTSATSYADGGTQSGPGTEGSIMGSFGQGANGTSSSYVGGGGGYYGGNSSSYAGGGGSGYIGNSRLTDKAMYCYECIESTDESTLTYTTTNYSSTATSNYAKSGDGAVKISLIKVTIDSINEIDEIGVPTREGYEFVEWNTSSDGSGTTVTSSNSTELSDVSTLYAIWS